MPLESPRTRFAATLHQPAPGESDGSWTFLCLPREASDPLPRRGRTTIHGTLNGCPFQVTLEPDGRKGHWMKVPEALRKAAGAQAGGVVTIEMSPVDAEPEPALPPDFQEALQHAPAASLTWNATTTLARLDWIHWIESPKPARTRTKRIHDACKRLAEGKKRVCCFDPSGFYSKAFSPPTPAR